MSFRVRSCLLITLIKGLKCHKSLGLLFNVKMKKSVTEWQGHLLSCLWTARNEILIPIFLLVFSFSSQSTRLQDKISRPRLEAQDWKEILSVKLCPKLKKGLSQAIQDLFGGFLMNLLWTLVLMNIYCLFIWIFSKLKIQGQGSAISSFHWEKSNFGQVGRITQGKYFVKYAELKQVHIYIIIIYIISKGYIWRIWTLESN